MGRCQHFPAQYACSCTPAYIPPQHSLSHVSAAVPILRFNHHPRLFCFPNHPASLPYICSYPPRLCPPLSPASLLATRHCLFCPRHLLTRDHTHILLCWGGDDVTFLHNNFFYCFLFAPTLFCFSPWRPSTDIASGTITCTLCGVGYHLRPAVSTAVRLASYRLAHPTPSSLYHPIISAPLCCHSPPLVALHIRRISTRTHRLHCHRIYATHRPHHCCCPLERICICLSSAMTPILIEPLAFYLLTLHLSSCPARLPKSYLRHPIISSSLIFAPPLQYIIPTTLPTSYLSI